MTMNKKDKLLFCMIKIVALFLIMIQCYVVWINCQTVVRLYYELEFVETAKVFSRLKMFFLSQGIMTSVFSTYLISCAVALFFAKSKGYVLLIFMLATLALNIFLYWAIEPLVPIRIDNFWNRNGPTFEEMLLEK